MMAESLVLAIPGALVGVGLAYGVCRVASTIVLPSARADVSIDLDASAVVFAILLAVLSALACGALPALELIRKPLPDALGRGTDTQHGRLLSHRALVVGQVIASTMLVLLAARCIAAPATARRRPPSGLVSSPRDDPRARDPILDPALGTEDCDDRACEEQEQARVHKPVRGRRSDRCHDQQWRPCCGGT
jgi:hypothetical protein